MKITDTLHKAACQLAEKRGYTELYANDKGELFTSANLASLSVENDKTKWAKVELVAIIEKAKKTTTDLQKAEEVIAIIEAATEAEKVEAIAKAEAEGKNRKSVMEAAAKKIDSLVKNAQ